MSAIPIKYASSLVTPIGCGLVEAAEGGKVKVLYHVDGKDPEVPSMPWH